MTEAIFGLLNSSLKSQCCLIKWHINYINDEAVVSIYLIGHQAGVDANSRAVSHEQKINLLHDKLEEMSRVKSDLEAKVSSVSNVVHQYAASGSHQRTPSGENRSRANSRGRKRSKSPWRQTTNDLAETVRMQIQNLTSKYSTSEKSRYIST